MSFKESYLKYKNKYLNLKNKINQIGGAAVAPAPLVVGDHIQSMNGIYWGNVVTIEPLVYRLNNNRIARKDNQGITWKKLVLPANVRIYDQRPPLGLGPHPADINANLATLGDFVCGIDGTYWGQIYDRNGNAWKLISNSPPPIDGRFIGRDTENVNWRPLRLPKGVILIDSRPDALRISILAANQFGIVQNPIGLPIGLAIHAEITANVVLGNLLINAVGVHPTVHILAATIEAARNAPNGPLPSYTFARRAYVISAQVHAPGAPVPGVPVPGVPVVPVVPIAPVVPVAPVAPVAPGAPAQAGRPDIRTTLAAIQNIKAPTQIEAIMNRSIEDIEAERARTGLPPLTADERTQEQRRIQEIIAFQDHITCPVCKENLKNVLICRAEGHQFCATCTLDWIRVQDERNGYPPVQQVECPMCRTPCQLTDIRQTRQKYLKY